MSGNEPLPFWILGSGPEEKLPLEVQVSLEAGLTPDKLRQLRSALAVYADDPPVTLERYQLPLGTIEGGMALAPGAPILSQLGQIVGSGKRLAQPTVEGSAAGTETLYRMVVDKSLATQLSQGLAKPMQAAKGGIHGGILGKSGIVGQARFVPVSTAQGGGVGLAAAGGASAVGIGGAVVAAAPFVILAIAAASTVYTEEQRRRALERIEDGLQKLQRESLEGEVAAINGATSALAKATSLLADEGRLGSSLGIDSAAYAIDTAVERAKARTKDWLKAVERLADGATPAQLNEAFPGIQDADGLFVTELRVASLAIASKRRAMVLQAVEHAQINANLSLKRFLAEIKREAAGLEKLESDLMELLTRVSELRIRPGAGIKHKVMLPREVEDLLRWPERLREVRNRESPRVHAAGSVEVGIVVAPDGSARILEPAVIDG